MTKKTPNTEWSKGFQKKFIAFSHSMLSIRDKQFSHFIFHFHRHLFLIFHHFQFLFRSKSFFFLNIQLIYHGCHFGWFTTGRNSFTFSATFRWHLKQTGNHAKHFERCSCSQRRPMVMSLTNQSVLDHRPSNVLHPNNLDNRNRLQPDSLSSNKLRRTSNKSSNRPWRAAFWGRGEKNDKRMKENTKSN